MKYISIIMALMYVHHSPAQTANYGEGKVACFIKRAGQKKTGKAERIELLNLPDSLVVRYAGTYMDGPYPLSIIKKDNYLWFDYGPDQPMMKMNFFSGSSFYLDEDFGAEYEFIVDAKGEVDGIFAKAGKREKIIKRIL
jgi:hypothetical protein